jgi:rubrerythrin
MKMNFNESQTKINLMRAFAGESQARQRYYQSALIAQKQYLVSLERMFRFTAEQEEQHAIVFFNLLKEAAGSNIEINAGYPADAYSDIQQLLDSAAKAESDEFGIVYPDFALVAQNEGFPEAASKFKMIGEIENTHRARFEYYAKLWRDGMMFRSESTEERWMCLNCGHIHVGSEPPANCPVCGVKQGFFIREAEAPFTFSGIIA